jgi:hypothetical protein
MQNQIELPFRSGRESCRSRHGSRRAQWARLWFARMHEVVEASEDFDTTDAPANQPTPTGKAEERN